jgi:DNA-binding transcriptional LysR family regulator
MGTIMDLRQLRYFIAVAEEGNFGAAALKVNVTQPPVTRQILALERDLGVRLFDRTSRGAVLTEAGRLLLKDARQVVDLAGQARKRLQAVARGDAGCLTVGFLGSSVYEVIPALLRQFREAVPAVEVSLVAMAKDRQIEALRNRAIDIGFARHFPFASDMTSVEVSNEPLLVALPVKHPLAGNDSLSVAEISRHPVVLFPIGGRPSFADAVLSLLQSSGCAPTIGGEAEDASAALAMAAIGCGVCVIPRSVTRLHTPGVVFVPLNEAPKVSPIQCIYLTANTSLLLTKFVTLAKSAARVGREALPTAPNF